MKHSKRSFASMMGDRGDMRMRTKRSFDESSTKSSVTLDQLVDKYSYKPPKTKLFKDVDDDEEVESRLDKMRITSHRRPHKFRKPKDEVMEKDAPQSTSNLAFLMQDKTIGLGEDLPSDSDEEIDSEHPLMVDKEHLLIEVFNPETGKYQAIDIFNTMTLSVSFLKSLA